MNLEVTLPAVLAPYSGFPIAVIGGIVLGSLLLAVGLFLRRAGFGLGAGALLVVQVVVNFLASNALVNTISFVLLAVVFGAIAWKIMRHP